MRTLPVLLLSWSLLYAGPAETRSRLGELDALIEKRLTALKIPGLAYGVWQDGELVAVKGFGVRDLRSRQPVTGKTLFAMGSVTKSFTSAVLATLVDEGKLEWDRPVREYLPWFRMSDPVATELVTLRDMLSHRTGLPRHDMMRFALNLSREELVRRIRFLPLNYSFRDRYQYNNLMFVTAGYIGGVAGGSTWEDQVKDRIFTPVGMTRSTVSVQDSQKSDDFARPHSIRDGAAVEEEFYDYQKYGVGPNGAVNSNVEDMLKYLRMYLDGGAVNGKQVISKRQLAQLWRPVTVVEGDTDYALGWMTDYYRGHYRIAHGGSIIGFRAEMAILPQQKAAIVAMVNADVSVASDVLRGICDRVLGLPPEVRNRQEFQPPAAPVAVAGTKPSRELADYAGRYFHPAYGDIQVTGGEAGLRVAFPAGAADLKHFHFDTFSTNSRLFRWAQFQLDAMGRVHELHLPLEPATKPFVFVRR